MAKRNWTTCSGCDKKINRKKFAKARILVCYPCHLKELKDKRKGIIRGKNRR